MGREWKLTEVSGDRAILAAAWITELPTVPAIVYVSNHPTSGVNIVNTPCDLTEVITEEKEI